MGNWKSDRILNGNYSSYLNGKFHEFNGLIASLDEIKKQVENTLDYAASVEDKNKELEDEHWKDKKLAEMKEKYSQLESEYHGGFPISEWQRKAIREWEDQHWTKRHNAPDNLTRIRKSGAIGGSFEYRFVPTSIGTVGKICCQACMRKVDAELRQYENLSIADYRKKKDEIKEKYDSEFVFQDL